MFLDSTQWRGLEEGKRLYFRVEVDDGSRPFFSLDGNPEYGILFDSTGQFDWTPSFDFVDRLQGQREVNVLFKADWKDGRKIRKSITFTVRHVNRPPHVEELPAFYVKQNVQSVYQATSDYVHDPDGDPIIFKSIPSQMPEGLTLNSTGQWSWKPSRSQFASLKSQPLVIEFLVQDQPAKEESRGRLRIAPTQLDLPPELLLVPSDSLIKLKENETLNLKLYASDPNGDENISSVNFICSDPRVPKHAFKENAPTQFEFTWTPGYAFVDDSQKQLSIELLFFVLDKSGNRTQRKLMVEVSDAENIQEKDKLLYSKYIQTLSYAKALIDQLDENLEYLNKAYKQANKGRRHRAILNASLGATTGLSPLVLPTDESRVVSGIGGTTVLTLGTLEATEVLGKSKTAIQDKIRVNIEIRNQLQVEGDAFARKYALKSARRAREFDTDRDKMQPVLNNQKLILLELDASKPAVRQYNNRELKKTFPDFAGEE